MNHDTKALIWNFGRLLWENEYGEDPGEFENPNKTNMVKIFDDHIKSIQPKYTHEWVNIDATDCPLRITNSFGISKEYGVEGFPWRIISREETHKESEEDFQIALDHVFSYFPSDIKIRR